MDTYSFYPLIIKANIVIVINLYVEKSRLFNQDKEQFMVKIQRFGEWCEIEVPVHWEGYTVEYIVRTLWGAPKNRHTI